MSFKLLHVASFDGNIGDNASHSGTYQLLGSTLGANPEIRQLEIRKTYQNYQGTNRWYFDQSFIDAVNQSDLTVIGGGNYFELWLEESATGTTIDLPPSLLKQVNKPLVFNGLGCDPYKGYSDNTLGKFKSFLEAAAESEQILVSVRNDGSHRHIVDLLGKECSGLIDKIPDPGFFVSPKHHSHPEICKDLPYWVVNLATDMPELRFDQKEDNLDYSSFIEEFASVVKHFLQSRKELEVILVPHIYSDLQSFSDLLSYLPDPLRRSRIKVAPYVQGFAGADYLFDLYKGAELTIGTRFHANVCPIGMAVPSIGLVTYPKLADTYAELGLEQRCVKANLRAYSDKLISLVDSTCQNLDEISEKYDRISQNLRHQAEAFYSKIVDKL